MTPRRARLLVLVLLALGVLASPAAAYWQVGGAGTWQAAVAELGPGLQPIVSAASLTVTVTWTQTPFADTVVGAYGGGYTIRRYRAGDDAAVTPNGTCGARISGTAATLSCEESGIPAGDWEYTVTPVLNSWTGAESARGDSVSLQRPAAPTGVTATPAAASAIDVAWSAVEGADGYNVYRRTSDGSYSYTSPLNGAAPHGAGTFNDATAAHGVSYRYVVRAVGFAGVESLDSDESAAVTADGVAPGSVVLSDPGSPLRATVVLAGSATDAGSGVATLRFEIAPTGEDTWTHACTAAGAPGSCDLWTGSLPDGLYDLRVVATDAAGNSATSAVLVSRRIDNTAPSATMGDPGAFLRATVTLAATAIDGGSGLASLRIQSAPAGSSTWTDVCSTAASPADCALNTAALADGGYDLRAVASDVAGNTTTSATVANRVVDNLAPTGVDVQTTNVSGGTAGRPESADTIVYTFSEPVLGTSILPGWSGGATAVTVRFTNGNPDVLTVFDAANTAAVTLGSVTSGRKYVTANITFAASTMVMAANKVTITLGAPSGATATATGGNSTLRWTTSTAATDLAGNPMGAATVLEAGIADLDF
jgi:hypothetical protein